MSWNPDRQLYVAVSPNDIPVVSITPFDICLSSGQEAAAGREQVCKICCAIHMYIHTICDKLHVEKCAISTLRACALHGHNYPDPLV